jgi:catechol 2,3-dioxygenase-like lactoylglutathione lyase family enzyme
MKIEHVAFQVTDAPALARWYVEHLGFTIKRASDTPPYMHFLADDSGTVMIEVYSNPAVTTPDYPAMNPLLLHLALITHDSAADKARLLAAGATVAVDTTTTPDGDELTMLRDPWGFPLQLVRRKVAMI